MAIAESLLQCNIGIVSWEEILCTGTKAMTPRFRPIHSGFETLRIAGSAGRTSRDYHRFGTPTNEQLTAIGYRHITRQSEIFADFRER